MGLTIHYRGKINDVERLPALVTELTDIAKWMGWKSNVIDDDWSIPPDARLEHGPKGAVIKGHLGLRGACLHPGGGSESLEFLFDREGNLRSLMGMIMICEGHLRPEESWISVKTQFAGPDLHVWVVGLLKHLAKHYISNLEVSDEGSYWETGDRQELERKMRFLGEMIDRLANKLSNAQLDDVAGMSADEVADHIERLVREQWEERDKDEPGPR